MGGKQTPAPVGQPVQNSENLNKFSLYFPGEDTAEFRRRNGGVPFTEVVVPCLYYGTSETTIHGAV